MRYTRFIIRSGMFDKVWNHVLILVVGGLETIAILKEICYHINVMDAKDAETKKGSLCLNCDNILIK
jgi:hypothetical protein